MSESLKVDPIQAVAMTLVSSALIERCREMIARLTTPRTIMAEIDEFRNEALRHIKDAETRSLASGDRADAIGLAQEHIAAICADWMRGVSGPPGTPTLN